MSTLFNVLFAWKCANTHHKMVMDALNQLQSEQGERWRDLCLAHVDRYLEGSKAPDNQFKDFRNHVLHVQENHWGGAVASTRKWYDLTVAALKQQNWSDAIYAAGVLSHYYTDPIQPLHTGQCEAENVIHRACEWSIACSYSELTEILLADLGGWPDVPIPEGPAPTGEDWLAQMVTAGADRANPHYQTCLDHYNLARGVKTPPLGLDQELKDLFAGLIGYAVVGFARIMDQALLESRVEVPPTNLTLQSVLAQVSIPILWVTKKLKDAKERVVVEAMYREFQETGKVIDTLSDDDAIVRDMHATEVLKKPLEELDLEPLTPLGTAHGMGTPARTPSLRTPLTRSSRAAVTPVKPMVVKPIAVQPAPAKEPAPVKGPAPASSPKLVPEPVAASEPVATSEPVAKIATPQPITPPVTPPKAATREPVKQNQTARGSRFYLDRSMQVEKAPSIGPKMAARLFVYRIETVGDLLSADPEALSQKLNQRSVDAETIRDWQHQAALCCDVPNLRGHDAQILTACGVHDRETLAAADKAKLLKQVESFVETAAGKRILRDGAKPDREEVADWIAWAHETAKSKAA